jgi:adenosylcobinamide-GDP ribazoletransferase
MAGPERAIPFPLPDLAAAFTLLTRLPVHRLNLALPAEAFARSIWAYPVAGAVVGGLGGLVATAAATTRLPAGFAAAAALGTMVLLTGGLHEDGVADTADGLGGGATRERKLAIMRDSRIGSFGAIALILAFAARLAAITALPSPIAGLAAAAALGRAAMLVPLLLLPPARSDGMAAGLGRIGAAPALSGLALGAAAACAFLPPGAAVTGVAAAALGGLGMTWLARRQLAGVTGDILGATCVAVECLVLGVAAR